jgi:hypothetical protein
MVAHEDVRDVRDRRDVKAQRDHLGLRVPWERLDQLVPLVILDLLDRPVI